MYVENVVRVMYVMYVMYVIYVMYVMQCNVLSCILFYCAVLKMYSMYVRTYVCMYVCMCVGIPQFLNLTTSKTKQFCETSSFFKLDNVKNEAIVRYFLQKLKVECRDVQS